MLIKTKNEAIITSGITVIKPSLIAARYLFDENLFAIGPSISASFLKIVSLVRPPSSFNSAKVNNYSTLFLTFI